MRLAGKVRETVMSVNLGGEAEVDRVVIGAIRMEDERTCAGDEGEGGEGKGKLRGGGGAGWVEWVSMGERH